VIPDPKADVRVGWPVVLAMDCHLREPLAIAPTPDPRIEPDWILRGYITGVDAVGRACGPMELGGTRTCYGLFLESAATRGSFVAAIRGTHGLIEWAEDAEFLLTSHPMGGHVEAGFWGIYLTMGYLPVGAVTEVPLAEGIAAYGGTVTVVGHSLGGALATYLTLDLAARTNVRGRFFASARPGDAGFAEIFDRAVADYVCYTRTVDIVPHVPIGYTPLRNAVEITPTSSQAKIAFGLDCWHHMIGYLASIDYSFMDWQSVPAIDQPNAACIKGRNA